MFLRWIHRAGVGQEIHKSSLFAFRTERGVERDGAQGDLSEFGHPMGIRLQFIGQLSIGGLAAEFGSEGGADSAQALDFIDKMNGKTNGFALVSEGTADGLFNPPAGVGAELNPAAGFEAIDRLHQSEIAF